jgi:preprotein translocase subunit SecA
VDALRAEIDADPQMDIHERERRYQDIDKLQENGLAKIEEVLLEILPEAFAVVKETARRFKENRRSA